MLAMPLDLYTVCCFPPYARIGVVLDCNRHSPEVCAWTHAPALSQPLSKKKQLHLVSSEE